MLANGDKRVQLEGILEQQQAAFFREISFLPPELTNKQVLDRLQGVTDRVTEILSQLELLKTQFNNPEFQDMIDNSIVYLNSEWDKTVQNALSTTASNNEEYGREATTELLKSNVIPTEITNANRSAKSIGEKKTLAKAMNINFANNIKIEDKEEIDNTKDTYICIMPLTEKCNIVAYRFQTIDKLSEFVSQQGAMKPLIIQGNILKSKIVTTLEFEK